MQTPAEVEVVEAKKLIVALVRRELANVVNELIRVKGELGAESARLSIYKAESEREGLDVGGPFGGRGMEVKIEHLMSLQLELEKTRRLLDKAVQIGTDRFIEDAWICPPT